MRSTHNVWRVPQQSVTKRHAKCNTLRWQEYEVRLTWSIWTCSIYISCVDSANQWASGFWINLALEVFNQFILSIGTQFIIQKDIGISSSEARVGRHTCQCTLPINDG